MPRIPMPRPVPTFRCNLVTLRPPDPEADARDYFTMNLDPEMNTWNASHVPGSVAEAQEELERMIAVPLLSTWMIIDNPTDRVVGRFVLCLEDRDGARVVGEGNRIARPYWNKGHEGEARALLFPYIFEELRADWIEVSAWAENEDSVQAIETHGFQIFEEETEWNEKHERDMVMRHYVLMREQWLEHA
jgi:RimJ/RimL family protein N-acetyltransferase